MAADTAVEKRAKLLASRARWGTVDTGGTGKALGRVGDIVQDIHNTIF